MSVKIISQEKDPVGDMFWVFAIHYQILLRFPSRQTWQCPELSWQIKSVVSLGESETRRLFVRYLSQP